MRSAIIFALSSIAESGQSKQNAAYIIYSKSNVKFFVLFFAGADFETEML